MRNIGSTRDTPMPVALLATGGHPKVASDLKSRKLSYRDRVSSGHDAEAIAEAVQRTTVKFVAAKAGDQLDLQTQN